MAFLISITINENQLISNRFKNITILKQKLIHILVPYFFLIYYKFKKKQRSPSLTKR